MKKRKFFKIAFIWMTALLVFGIDIPVDQNNIDVLAHFCAWYEASLIKEDMNTKPLRGFDDQGNFIGYNSYDPIVAAEQNQEKNYYGVGIDMISWSGPGHWQETWMLAGLFNSHNFYTRKFCMIYEIVFIFGERDYYDFSDFSMAQKFLDHIDYVAEVFGQYPNCYKIDNRPVIYIWTGDLRNFKWVSDIAREKVYLIGPEPMLHPPDDSHTERIERLKCFDAITSYGIHAVELARKYGSLNVEAVIEYVKAIVKWDRVLKLYAPDVELILPLQFAYHDNRGDRDSEGNTRILISSSEQAETFAKTVRFLLDGTKRTKIFLVSYNEHYEGTGAEPSKEYGYLWLELIKKYFVDKRTEPIDLNQRIKQAFYRERMRIYNGTIEK